MALAAAIVSMWQLAMRLAGRALSMYFLCMHQSTLAIGVWTANWVDLTQDGIGITLCDQGYALQIARVAHCGQSQATLRTAYANAE